MSSPAGDVVVTGVGAVTPHGVGASPLWDGVRDAVSVARVDDTGIGVVTRVPALDIDELLPRKLVAQTDRSVQLALIAADEAVRDATDGSSRGIADVDHDRVGVVIATGVGPVTSLLDEQRRTSGARERVRPYLAVTMPTNMAAGRIAQRHGLRGPALVVASACAAGTDAIGSARDMLRAGRADIALAGGTDAPIDPLTIAAFRSAGALSSRTADAARASRPFDVDRDGFVLGEGAGVLVLETAESAERRGARVLGSIVGYGATNDAYHPTQPAPDGRGATAAVEAALRDARMPAAHIGHINAHATSTPRNDQAEALVLASVLGSSVGSTPVTASKSTLGHLFGAAGAVEAIVALRSAAEGLVPPIANLDNVDHACASLDLVRKSPRLIDSPVALSVSFGFGGHNAALVLRAVRV